MNDPHVPEFQTAQSTSAGDHFTPLQDTPTPSRRKPLLIGLTLLIAVILPVAGFYVYTQTQTTNSQASVPACHTGAPPLPPDSSCYTGNAPSSLGDNNWTSCGAPAEGTCKKKNGACYECRDSIQGLRIICSCTDPTPTPPTKVECVSPLSCMDPAEASALGCTPSSDSANSNMCSRDGSASLNGVCCKPQDKPICESPKSCVPIDPLVGDINRFCEDGTMDPTASAGGCNQGTVCCIPRKPTPSPTPTPSPSPTPTPTTEPTPTPTITQACILPVISVTVTCATCSTPAQ